MKITVHMWSFTIGLLLTFIGGILIDDIKLFFGIIFVVLGITSAQIGIRADRR